MVYAGEVLVLALANLIGLAATPAAEPAAEPAATDETVDRGRGWYAPGAAIPEPPVALALVIVAAAGMRARERRRGAAR